MPAVLCIDIGATKTRMGIFSGGKIRSAASFPTPKNIEKAISLCAKKSTGMQYSRVRIAIAGSVENGIVTCLPNINAKNNFNAKKYAEIFFHAPVSIENDVKCAALAEAKYGFAKNMGKNGGGHGAGSRSATAVLVWPGSGIGGAILSDGKLLRGAGNSAGEFGHMKIFFGKGARKCGCGSRGCWETYCGGKGVERAYYSKYKKNKTAKEIFSSTHPADVAFAENAAFLFGICLSNIANALNPSIIIVGGSLSNAYLGKYARVALASFKSGAKPPADKAKIVKSNLENAVLLGAGLFPFSKPI